MAPDIPESVEKMTRKESRKTGSLLRRLWSRRVIPESSSSEPSPVVMVVEAKNRKAVVVVDEGEGVDVTGSREERNGSHEDGDVDIKEDGQKKDDEGDGNQEAGNDPDIDTGDESDTAKPGKVSAPLPNFWEKAWLSNEVGERRRILLQEHLMKPVGSSNRNEALPKTNSQEKVVEGVIKNTQERMASYAARWGSDDENRTTLGVARSILVSALTVKEVLDLIVKFDPTGYGSSAWAVVSFSLTLVQNDKDLMDLTFEACDYLADLMARYARIETYYRESKAERDKPLEDALVGVYIAILVYSAEVQASNVAKSLTRIRKSIISLTGQPLDDLKKKIDSRKAKLEEWQKVVDRENAAEAAKKLSSIEGYTAELLKRVDELTKDAAKTLHGIKTEELRELWKSLRDMEGESQSNIRKDIDDDIAWWKSSGDDQWKLRSLRSKAKGKKRKEMLRFEETDDEDGKKSTKSGEDGSDDDNDDDKVLEKASEDNSQGDEFGDWLFRTKEYTEWIKYPQGLLWLYGNSGCGKPALCAAITKNLKETFEKNDMTKKVFASWHFRHDIDDTKRLNLMLVSLLRQLASKCQGFRDEDSHSAFRGFQDDGALPTEIKYLLIYLRRFINKIDKDVFLVFDGVDQVPERQGTRDSDPKLLDIIKSLAHKRYPNLHILVVSRDEKDIRLYLERNMQEMLVSIDVKEGLSKALDILINKKLEGTAMTSMLKEGQDVKKKGQGTNFLWASSVLRQVFQCHDARDVKQALKKIPDNINSRYQMALDKVTERNKDRMKSILLWLRWQERELSQDEFVAAAGLPSLAAVTEICSRVLIETAMERREVAGRPRMLEVFRFTHSSVQEYLDTIFAKNHQVLIKSSKMARHVSRLSVDAQLLITQRCLAILSACGSSQKTRTHATAKTGSDADWDRRDTAASDSDGTRDDDSIANGTGRADRDSEEDRQSISTVNTVAYGGCPEWPARKYAAEFWFRHYEKIDREKVSYGSQSPLLDLERDICLHVLWDADEMRFWLRIHDPDGNTNETVPSPLYYALKLKLESIPMLLIKKIAKLPAETANQRAALLDNPGAEGTALQLAAHQGNHEILEELIKLEVNVNSNTGPHGTALYASAARGDKDAVEKLWRAGATLDGENQGALGSPLHVAAFKGHNAIVELLLDQGDLPVDQPASLFGTALQAASAGRQPSTVNLLLNRNADPNIVGGCLGTAAQAVFADDEKHWSQRDTVLEELRSRNAQLLDGPLFWTMAYERATSQDTPIPVSEAYTLLLRMGLPMAQESRLVPLGDRQELLASVISYWTIPVAEVLGDTNRLSRSMVSRLPFQDQLDAIRRAAPQHELDIQHLSHGDFMHKACFWAGIKCILAKLPRLVMICIDRVFRELSPYEFRGGRRRRGDQYANVSSVLPFRWAFEDFEENIPYNGRGVEVYRVGGKLTLGPIRYAVQANTWAMKSFMNRSDLIAMELMQQRQRLRQLEAMLQPSLPTEEPPSRDEDDIRQVLESASRAGVLVTSDVLDLVKTLVECGDRCARYQDAVEDSTATGYREHVEELTFELFSATIRLALILDRDGPRPDFERIARPIQLLTTVRMPRIKELDAICDKGLVPKHVCTNARVELGSGLEEHGDKMAETIATQVGKAIGDKLAGLKRDIVCDIQKSIRDEVARLMEETRKGLEKKVHDEVQPKATRAQAVQPQGGMLWQKVDGMMHD